MSNQSELDEILAAVYLAGVSGGLHRDISDPEEIMHRKAGFIKANPVSSEARQLILDWHNKQVLAIIGEDDIQQRNDEDFDDWLVCATCDCILSDETEPEYSCRCTTRNSLRAEQRNKLKESK